MAITKLILGSNNPAKINEWKKLLGKDMEIISIAEAGDFPEPEESGKTFQENARLKAEHYAFIVRDFILADDSGFEIDALNGAPGVKSRRILPGDKEGTDQQVIDYVLGRMKGIPKEKRAARLKACAAISDKDGNIIFEDCESIEGVVTDKLEAEIIPGFPYRSIFYIPETKNTYAELSDEQHERLNHRRKIARKLLEFCKNFRK